MFQHSMHEALMQAKQQELRRVAARARAVREARTWLSWRPWRRPEPVGFPAPGPICRPASRPAEQAV